MDLYIYNVCVLIKGKGLLYYSTPPLRVDLSICFVPLTALYSHIFFVLSLLNIYSQNAFAHNFTINICLKLFVWLCLVVLQKYSSRIARMRLKINFL